MTTLINGIDVDALGKFVETAKQDPENAKAAFKVSTSWDGQTKTKSKVSSYSLFGKEHARNFEIVSDEPIEVFGQNSAPNPQELLMAALNACMTITFVAAAAGMGVTLDKLEIISEGELDLRGFLGLDPAIKAGYEELRYTIRVKSDAPKEKLEEIHQQMRKTSPNFSNIATEIRLVPTLIVDAT